MISSSGPDVLRPIADIIARHHTYRAWTLNLIAFRNVMSPWVEGALDTGLGHRYGDFHGIDPTDCKYTGNRFLAELDLAAVNICTMEDTS